MNRSSRPRVLAIGIDAAEPTLVRTLIDQGELPSLRALLERGAWGEVRSPADIASGAVWPTFMTGKGPADHGIYSAMPWDPRAMRLVRLTTDHLTPFWQGLSHEGYAVGILDVPFAPVTEITGGIEISEWGAHDRMRGRMLVSPQSLHDWLARTVDDHPLGKSRGEISGPRDWRGLRKLAAACQAGTRLRGTLAARLLAEWRLDVLLAVFPEVHHASHYLWHTLDPAASAFPSVTSDSSQRDIPSLIDVYRETDRQIGQLTRAAGENATVLIFSLHGMRATQGIPTVLDPLLKALGLASLKRWRGRSWAEHRRWAVSTIKHALPDPLLRLYRRAARSTLRLPRQQIQLPYDWPRTAAFSVPTDQHGWLRLNLKGREAEGTVSLEHYDEVCIRLEQVLRDLLTERGDRVVADVVRIGRDAGNPSDLPDLVVHWHDHALANPLRVASPRIVARAMGTRFTGQHAPQGFFILRPPAGQTLNPGASVAAEELHRLIRAGLKA